jgi:hypothetical protein
MAYTGNPYVVVPDSMVDVDAPVSTTLMNYVGKDNPEWLYSAISDGEDASQGITTSTLRTYGTATIGGDLTLNGDTIDSTAAALKWECPTVFTKGAAFDGELTLMGINLGFMSAYRIFQGEI